MPRSSLPSGNLESKDTHDSDVPRSASKRPAERPQSWHGHTSRSVQDLFAPPRTTPPHSERPRPASSTMEASRQSGKDPFAGANLEATFEVDEETDYGFPHHVGSFTDDEFPPRSDMKKRKRRSPMSSPPYVPYASMPLQPFYPPYNSTLGPPQPPGYFPRNVASAAGNTYYGNTTDYYPPLPSNPGYLGPPGHTAWNSPVPKEYSPHRPTALDDTLHAADHELTPEKDQQTRPVFRSPMLRDSKYKRSPLGSPLDQYGSFGMVDTPRATLEDAFSPLGPSFENDLGLSRAERFRGCLELSRSGSSGEFETHPTPQSTAYRPPEPSPFSRLVNEFSPSRGRRGLQGVSRTPVRSAVSDRYAPSHSSRPLAPSMAASMPKAVPRSSIQASPMAPQSGAKPLKLYQGSPAEQQPSTVRMKLDGRGLHSTQRTLNDINSMMRSGSMDRAGATPYGQSARSPYAHAGMPYHPSYANMVPETSAVKAPRTAHSIRPSPMGSHYGPPPPSSSTSRPSRFPSSIVKTPLAVPGKENPNGITPMSTPRNRCNCKKSQCLKLYCECFSAKVMCEGCNCTDCRNLPAFAAVRAKAMTDCRNKNAHAFKPRIAAAPGAADLQGHSMGCKCKKSECLKKYCECFQAGVLCGLKCKCEICKNIAGSQKLIDKRRQMKDTSGAEFAMRVSQEAWKTGSHTKGGLPGQHVPAPPPAMNRNIQPAAASHHSGGTLAPHPYMRSYHHITPQVGSQMPMGYSMGMHMPPFAAMYPGAYHVPPPMHQRLPSPPTVAVAPSAPETVIREATKPEASMITPGDTPRIAALRITFDIEHSRKKRVMNAADEETVAYFGSLPRQPKTTALAIFSYLSNTDVYQCALVSKLWKNLAFDEDLWQFPKSSEKAEPTRDNALTAV